MPVTGTVYYHLGPWQWVSDDIGDRWAAPADAVSAVDLRPVAACGTGERHELNFGFFATRERLGSDYLYLGSSLDDWLDKAARDGWADTLGLDSLSDCTVLDALWMVMTRDAVDPDRRALPIMPTHTGTLELHLAGHSLVKSRKFAGESDEAWPAIQRVVQSNYRGIRERAQSKGAKDDKLHQRYLTILRKKLCIADTDLFIPSGLPKEKALAHNTEYSDGFGRADEPLSDGPWVAPRGTWNVVSNAVKDGDSADPNTYTYYSSALSSDDHYSQIDLTWVEDSSSILGPACRVSSSAATYYRFVLYPSTAGRYLQSIVNFTATTLDYDTVGPTSLPVTLKLSADGSTITAYAAGSEILSATNTAITGNLYAGICGRGGSHNSAGDDFICADLAAGGVTVPVFWNHYEGMNI